MSREIKFRAKVSCEFHTDSEVVDSGEWIEGFYTKSPEGYDLICCQMAMECGGVGSGLAWVYVPIDINTLGQFTGLLDKNGKEIYDGDIVVEDDYIWFDNGEPNYVGVVEWVFSQWQVIAHCINPDKAGISDGMNYGLNDSGVDENTNSDWQVIGNIYENPELKAGAK